MIHFDANNNLKRDTRFYNVVFPIWILMMFPVSWLFVVPANYVIDSLVLFLGMFLFSVDDKLEFYKKNIILVFVFGFLSDMIGGGLMFLTQFFGEKGAAYEYLTEPIATNPFDNIYSLLYTVTAVALSGGLIYVLNRYVSFRKVRDKKLKRKIALLLALITAPYTLFIPSTSLYGGEIDCFTNHIVWSEHVRSEVYLADDPSINIMEGENCRAHSYILMNALKEGINTADGSDEEMPEEWNFKVLFFKGGDNSDSFEELYFYHLSDKLYFTWNDETYVVSAKHKDCILLELGTQSALSDGTFIDGDEVEVEVT